MGTAQVGTCNSRRSAPKISREILTLTWGRPRLLQIPINKSVDQKKHLSQKTALVTGASRGIGAAIARRLAADGFHVIVNHPPGEGEPAATLTAIRTAGGSTESAAADVGVVGQVQAMFARIAERHGRLDVLVNNAGICPFLEWDAITEANWDRTHAVNLKGAFFCTQAAARLMVRSKTPGRIVCISSISALKGGSVQVHYCPTKGGMISMMAAFAVCLGPHGITCNSVLPGTIETPMNADYLATLGNRESLERGTCVGFLGQPDDVAGVVSFLCLPESRYVTGAAILADGGESVKHL